MTGGLHRLKDFADVIALIEALALSADFADQLNPYVRDKYRELWQGIRDSPVGPVETEPVAAGRDVPLNQTSANENEFPLAFGLDTGRGKEYNLLGDITGLLTLATGQSTLRIVLDPHLPVAFRQIFP